MITAILIDDEPNALKVLSMELKHYADSLEIRGQFVSAEEAFVFLQTDTVDVVFLDMDMPGLTGTEFLNKFPQGSFRVVYTTAHSKYAIQAVKNYAVDFLLKPVDPLELSQTIKRLEEVVERESLERQISAGLHQLRNLEDRQKKVKLSYEGKIVIFEPDEILYCKGEGNYSMVYLQNNEKLLFSFQLKVLEKQLPVHYFLRVHNSYIVNLSKVKSFHKNDCIIELLNNQQIPVSRQKKADIIEKL